MPASPLVRPRRAILAIAGLALGVLATIPVAASVVLPATLEELAGEADLVVHARVAHVDTRQAPGTLRVERLVALEVLRGLKGSADAQLQVLLPGGTLGRYRTVVPGVPDVVEGEELVLFLRTSTAPVPRILGLSQGLLRVRVDAATGQRLVAAPAGGGVDGPIVRGAPGRGPQPLASVEARIARVVLAQVRGRR